MSRLSYPMMRLALRAASSRSSTQMLLTSTIPSILTPDDFHFSSMETTEDMTRYISGGYHPIIIGDILGPTTKGRYRIVHKLGHGSFATVWLAQKTDSSNAFVAVKVTTAKSDPKECAMLEAAQTDDGTSRVLTLLDHFVLHGPNGIHSILVTEVVVPVLSVLSFTHTLCWRKCVARGLAQAVAQLHTKGIVHGDLHMGNVGLAFPQLADQDPNDVLQDLSPYDLTIVLPTSPAKKTPSLPAYTVASCNIAAYYNRIVRSNPQTKIFDLGSAHNSGMLPLSFECATEACAPEVAFARIVEKTVNPPVELPADIWALGTAIYEIVTGSSLFNGIGMSALPYEMAVMVGSVPPKWQIWLCSLSGPSRVSPSCADAWWESRHKRLRQNCVDEADAVALVTLLRKVLVLDPTVRLTAQEVLQDPWFQ